MKYGRVPMVFSDMQHNLCPESHFFLRVYLTFKYKLKQYYFEEKKLSATKHCTFVIKVMIKEK